MDHINSLNNELKPSLFKFLISFNSYILSKSEILLKKLRDIKEDSDAKLDYICLNIIKLKLKKKESIKIISNLLVSLLYFSICFLFYSKSSKKYSSSESLSFSSFLTSFISISSISFISISSRSCFFKG